jgi:hypothetical protein
MLQQGKGLLEDDLRQIVLANADELEYFVAFLGGRVFEFEEGVKFALIGKHVWYINGNADIYRIFVLRLALNMEKTEKSLIKQELEKKKTGSAFRVNFKNDLYHYASQDPCKKKEEKPAAEKKTKLKKKEGKSPPKDEKTLRIEKIN